eukprot:gb/GECG01012855.1/.p1 GENE.gb/GECG01012855.1/~~gb/GECG01012855.1/.p1  ORF type:complete len:256 (+),score=24.57 gb/GECG01012855.1/:1-768(+)
MHNGQSVHPGLCSIVSGKYVCLLKKRRCMRLWRPFLSPLDSMYPVYLMLFFSLLQAMNKPSKMLQFVNYTLRVTVQDTRVLVGQLLAFDTHMNLVLADCEEWRTLKTKTSSGTTEERQEKRFLGLVLLRGENVVSIQIQAPPPSESKPTGQQAGGPGVARSAGRGLSAAPSGAPRGLAGPVSGVGGPSANAMQPTGVAAASAPQHNMGQQQPQGGAPPGMPPGMPPRPPGMPPQPGMGYGAPQNYQQQQYPPQGQ